MQIVYHQVYIVAQICIFISETLPELCYYKCYWKSKSGLGCLITEVNMVCLRNCHVSFTVNTEHLANDIFQNVSSTESCASTWKKKKKSDKGRVNMLWCLRKDYLWSIYFLLISVNITSVKGPAALLHFKNPPKLLLILKSKTVSGPECLVDPICI